MKIEFLDAQGTRAAHVHRHAEGRHARRRRRTATTAAFFGGAPPRVGVKKGMNRFTWDMRYEGATVFPGMIMWAAQPQRGPAAPPGDYTVRITANGETKTPRLHDRHRSAARAPTASPRPTCASSSSCRCEIRDKVTEANQAVIADPRASATRSTSGCRRCRPRRKAEIQKLADGLLKPLAAVEEEVYQVRNRSGQDPLNYPIKLNNKIAALAGVVESADNKPTEQSYEVFKELSAQARRAAAEDAADAQDRAAAPERGAEAREDRRRRSRQARTGRRSDTGMPSRRTPAASPAGVVYGDIGTSPLYALRECFHGAARRRADAATTCSASCR